MNQQEEALVILMEECSEVSVEASKILRFGNEYTKLENEIGDLMFMVGYLVEKGLIDLDRIEKHAENKREKLRKWSNLDL